MADILKLLEKEENMISRASMAMKLGLSEEEVAA